MNLEEQINSMSDNTKIKMAVDFLEMALPIWEEFCRKPDTDLSYYAFLLGINHVDPSIVSESISLAKSLLVPHNESEGQKIIQRAEEIYKDFREHNMGLQDMELEMDYKAELVFYAAYNLICFITGEIYSFRKEHSIYISVNQAVDALLRCELTDTENVRKKISAYTD